MTSRDIKPRLAYWRLAAAVLFLLVAVSALANLGRESLWLDESHSAYFISLPWDASLRTLREVGVHPPFYFVLLKLVSPGLDPGDAQLRLLSVFSHLLGTATIIWFAWRRAGPPVALAAGWFWGFHPMLLWYAREARPYALAACLAALTVVMYISLRSAPSKWGRIVLVGLLAAGLLTHYFFFLLIAGLTILELTEIRSRPKAFRHWAEMVLVGMVPLLLWLAWYLSQPNPALGIGWIQRPRPFDIVLTFWNLWSGYGGRSSAATAAFGVCALVLAAAAVWRRSARLPRLVLLVMPTLVLAVWLVSLLRPVYMDRYFIVLVPLATVLVARGAQAMWETVISHHESRSGVDAASLVVLMFAVGFLAGRQVLTDPTYAREDWRGLAQMMTARAGDRPNVLVADAESVVPFTRYYRLPFQQIGATDLETCARGCWRILRQPYTATHAFAQAISDPARPWITPPAAGCRVAEAWQSSTGLAAEHLFCDPPASATDGSGNQAGG